MQINTKKLKEEFHNMTKKLTMVLHGIEAVFILFLAAVIGITLTQNLRFNDSIISHLPNNLTAYEHVASLKKDEKLEQFFVEQASDLFKIPKTDIYKKMLPYFNGQTAIALLNAPASCEPILIFQKSKNFNDETEYWLTNNDIGITYLQNGKLAVLGKNFNILKNLKSSEKFQYSKQIKKFKRKNKTSLSAYVNLAGLTETGNRNDVDGIIINELKNKNQHLLAGLRKTIDGYEINIADMESGLIASAKITNSLLNDQLINDDITTSDTIFIAQGHYKNTLLKSIGLAEQEAKIIIFKNNNKNIQKKSNNSLHNELMLNGENSDYHYILAFKNNENNKKKLFQMKNFFVNYLDEKLPDERSARLPDGTYMTELWSNPSRFSFANSTIAQGVYVLYNDQLNFELSYSQTADYILLSNSQTRLADFLKTNQDVSFIRDSNDEKFYINFADLQDHSYIFKVLNVFGHYITGTINNM